MPGILFLYHWIKLWSTTDDRVAQKIHFPQSNAIKFNKNNLGSIRPVTNPPDVGWYSDRLEDLHVSAQAPMLKAYSVSLCSPLPFSPHPFDSPPLQTVEVEATMLMLHPLLLSTSFFLSFSSSSFFAFPAPFCRLLIVMWSLISPCTASAICV